MLKSPAETALIKEAVKLNESVLELYLGNIAAGGSELDAVSDASYYALQSGAEDLYWMTSSAKVPALGFLAASRARPRRWRQGDYHYVVIEHSCRGGYFSEITQLVSLGRPKEEYIEAYRAATAAQKEADDAIRPGVPVSRLADAAQNVLAEYGYCRKNDGPSPCVGHSQGLDAWEPPRISGDERITIRPGMRFNIHPVVTLHDGAKITSCLSYLSTEGEAELLSAPPGEIVVI
ncbi:MAG: M24 family metallopeptidase [Synergistaceae bacterium]|nr:M24 family metallopeptidase [Synergistaceae bacterium]